MPLKDVAPGVWYIAANVYNYLTEKSGIFLMKFLDLNCILIIFCLHIINLSLIFIFDRFAH